MNLQEANKKQEALKVLFDQFHFRNPETGKFEKDAYWKYPAALVVPAAEADNYNEALDWFVGGHEEPVPVHKPGCHSMVQVWSKGYYHYVGS